MEKSKNKSKITAWNKYMWTRGRNENSASDMFY